MKKILALLLVIGLIAGLATGCKSPMDTSGKTLIAIENTVDASMKGWATWVAGGNATDAQQAQVRTAYAEYQSAYAAACQAWIAAENSGDSSTLTQIIASLSAAATPLTTLVTQIEGAK